VLSQLYACLDGLGLQGMNICHLAVLHLSTSCLCAMQVVSGRGLLLPQLLLPMGVGRTLLGCPSCNRTCVLGCVVCFVCGVQCAPCCL
jgi:hypothetical protein